MWWLSAAAVVPYALFILAMMISPDSVAGRPLGGSVSTAILVSVLLYVWSVVVAIIYVRTTAADEAQGSSHP